MFANHDSNGGSREELIERHAAIKAEFDLKDEAYNEVKLTLEVSRDMRSSSVCANTVIRLLADH
jgi:hypothetical protein